MHVGAFWTSAAVQLKYTSFWDVAPRHRVIGAPLPAWDYMWWRNCRKRNIVCFSFLPRGRKVRELRTNHQWRGATSQKNGNPMYMDFCGWHYLPSSSFCGEFLRSAALLPLTLILVQLAAYYYSCYCSSEGGSGSSLTAFTVCYGSTRCLCLLKANQFTGYPTSSFGCISMPLRPCHCIRCFSLFHAASVSYVVVVCHIMNFEFIPHVFLCSLVWTSVAGRPHHFRYYYSFLGWLNCILLVYYLYTGLLLREDSL
jgi:hypothetical protein